MKYHISVFKQCFHEIFYETKKLLTANNKKSLKEGLELLESVDKMSIKDWDSYLKSKI